MASIYNMSFEFDDERVLNAQTRESVVMLYERGREFGFVDSSLTHRHEPDRTIAVIGFGSVHDPNNFPRDLIIERGVMNVIDWLGRVGLSGVSFSRVEMRILSTDEDNVRDDITIEAHAIEAAMHHLANSDPLA